MAKKRTPEEQVPEDRGAEEQEARGAGADEPAAEEAVEEQPAAEAEEVAEGAPDETESPTAGSDDDADVAVAGADEVEVEADEAAAAERETEAVAKAEDPAEAAPAPAADAAPEPVSEADLDRLFAGGGAGGAGAGPGLSEMLGEAAPPIHAFAAQAREVLLVGVESVTGQKCDVAEVSAATAGYEAIAADFPGTATAGMELRLTLAETESHLLAVLVPLADLGTLLGLETDPAAMADEEFQRAQGEAIATAARELFDLVSLTLFTDALSGAEATLAELRIGEASRTLATVTDAAHGGDAVRLDLSLALTGGPRVRLTLALPSALVYRLAELLAPEAALPQSNAAPAMEAERRDEPTPLRARAGAARGAREEPESGERGFGLTDNPDNISPIRPAAALGRDVEVHPVRFPNFGESEPAPRSPRSLDLIMDVQMRVSVELGRSTMTVEDVLSLGPGSVVELNKLAGEPVDVLVNEQLIARGEVVVVDENFGVRVTEIVSPRRRAQAMGR